MEMIDVLKELSGISNKSPEVAKAIEQVQKTNPADVKEENSLVAGKEVEAAVDNKDLTVKEYAPDNKMNFVDWLKSKGKDIYKVKGNEHSELAKAFQAYKKGEPVKAEGGMSDVHIGAQEVVGEFVDQDGNLTAPKAQVLQAMAQEKAKSPFPKSYEIETAMNMINDDFEDDGTSKERHEPEPDEVPHDVDTQMNMDAPAEEPKIQEEHTPMGTRMFFDMGSKLDIEFSMEQKGMMAGVLNRLDQDALMQSVDEYKSQELDPDQAESKDLDAPVITKNVLNTEAMTKEDKKTVTEDKKPVKEAITMSADTPEEAGMLMQIMKLAGVHQVTPDEIGAEEPSAEVPADVPTNDADTDVNPEHGEEGHDHSDCPVCGDDAVGSEDMGKMRDMISQNDTTENETATWDNEPDEKVSDVDTLVNVHSGGLNKQKQQVRKEYPGDNPLAAEDKVSEQDLANSLRNQYEGWKKSYKEATKVAEAKPDFLDMDKDGNKKEPMKKAIADKK
jgi:hypothetical protein